MTWLIMIGALMIGVLAVLGLLFWVAKGSRRQSREEDLGEY